MLLLHHDVTLVHCMSSKPITVPLSRGACCQWNRVNDIPCGTVSVAAVTIAGLEPRDFMVWCRPERQKRNWNGCSAEPVVHSRVLAGNLSCMKLWNAVSAQVEHGREHVGFQY
jgi:hypothetical protein